MSDRPRARESAEAKGRRYLVEGRLRLRRVEGALIEADCRGGGATYELGHDLHGWWCDCPARGRCAHLVALQLGARLRATRPRRRRGSRTRRCRRVPSRWISGPIRR